MDSSMSSTNENKAPMAARAVDSELGRLDRVITRLFGQIDQLQERLEYAMTPEMEPDGLGAGSDSVTERRSRITEAIESHNDQLDLACARIARIIDRLEI